MAATANIKVSWYRRMTGNFLPEELGETMGILMLLTLSI